MKKLFIADFDDTLAKVKATIYVRNGDREFTLTPAQFAVYVPKEGDVFNFKEFNAIIKKATPIKKNMDMLQAAAESPNTKTTILTARMLAYPVKKYLKKNFNLDIYVVALGDGNPQKKADYIEKQIQKGYDDIFFVDDSIKNVKAVEALKAKYPDVKLEVVHTTEAEHLDELRKYISEEIYRLKTSAVDDKTEILRRSLQRYEMDLNELPREVVSGALDAMDIYKDVQTITNVAPTT